ncbi:MAG TPA: tetratricopeptide repeat protein [Allosphingosinicella sp.]|nr:tetratricopeptide repeat protein [Allosphingosinicella sp.]
MRARAAILAGLLVAASACSNGLPPGGAGDAFRRAEQALAAGEPRTARIELLNAIKAQPSNRAFRLLQARVYLRLRDGGGAQAELDRARKLGASEAETAHLMAQALLLQGDAQGALREAAKAAPENSGYAERIAGQAYHALGDFARAGAAFDRALALTPRDADLWTEMARLRQSNGETAGALGAADRAVALDPHNVGALALRGILTRNQYGLAAAMPWFDRALELDPANVDALIERASTLGDLGRTTAMLADTRAILAASPGNPSAYYLQAVIAARAGRYDLARSLYRRTGGALDGKPSAMLLAGAIELQSGAPAQAAKRLQRLLQLQPANLKARRLLGSALLRSGDPAGAVRTLSPLAERDDADAYTLTVIGKAYAKLGDRRAASQYLARAVLPRPAATAPLSDPLSEGEMAALRRDADAHPDAAAPQVLYIRALLGRGLGGEALARARRLLAANPGAPDAHVLVGDALAISGDYRGAAGAYRGAANLAFTEPVALRLVEALRNSGDTRGAAQALGLFLAQNPQNVPAQLLAANAYLQARQWERAIRLYERVRARIGNGDSTLLNNLAWAYAQTGDIETALPLARHAYALDPRNPATADTLGWLLFRSGKDKPQGLMLLQQAARGAPSDSDILAHLQAAKG